MNTEPSMSASQVDPLVRLPFADASIFERMETYNSGDGYPRFVYPEQTYEMFGLVLQNCEADLNKWLCDSSAPPSESTIHSSIEAVFFVINKRWEEVQAAIARHRERAIPIELNMF